ncbi:unnamed protein product, partial [Ectocarpus fasciculatus]
MHTNQLCTQNRGARMWPECMACIVVSSSCREEHQQIPAYIKIQLHDTTGSLTQYGQMEVVGREIGTVIMLRQRQLEHKDLSGICRTYREVSAERPLPWSPMPRDGDTLLTRHKYFTGWCNLSVSHPPRSSFLLRRRKLTRTNERTNAEGKRPPR